MVMIDRLVSSDGYTGIATVVLEKDCIFRDAWGRVPCFVGLELMVQTVAAMAGLERYRQGLKPLVGLIMGTRLSRFAHSYFPVIGELHITMRNVLLEESIAVYDGQVEVDGEIFVWGKVKAIQPPNEAELQALMADLQ